jgi:membrane associated rhomboid family serine protease
VPFLSGLVKSPAVLPLIAVLVIVFVAQLATPGLGDRLSLPGSAADLGDRPWSPLTVMFVHDNIVHLVVMVVMLAGFGALLEQRARSVDVVAVYLIAGLAGSLAVVATLAAFETDGTLVGASAAVFGVAAAALVMRPSSRILGGTATQWLVALVAINIVFLLSQPLSSVAHLTGVAVGVAYGSVLMQGTRANPATSDAGLFDGAA